MRLTRLEMDNFGPFSGHKVDGFSSGLTVVHGENEAGKSALRAFMRVILFGFPRARSQERADYYYEPILPGGAGGSLFVTDPNGDPYSINRVEGVRGGPVTISGTRDGGDDLLHELIGGVDDAFYQNVFSISLTQLQSFEALGRDEIPERIYSAGLGMGNVSLRGVTRTLDDRISRLQRTASTRSTAGSLFDVEKQLRTAREKLDEKRRELAEYGRLSDELRELERSAKELGEELSELRASAARTGRLLDLRDSWLNARRLRDEISSLPASRPILVGGVERLDEIERVRRETEERIAQDDRRERERNRQVADLPVVEAFARREDDVRKVVGRIGYYQDAVRDIPRRSLEADEIENGVTRDVVAVGSDWTVGRVSAFNDQAAAIARIQSAADARDTARREEEDAHSALAAAEEESRNAGESLVNANDRLNAVPDLPIESLDQLEHKRARLERLEGALAELESSRSALATGGTPSRITGSLIPGLALAAAGMAGIAWAGFTSEVTGIVTGLLALAAGIGLVVHSRQQDPESSVAAPVRTETEEEVVSITAELELAEPVSARHVVEVRNKVTRQVDRRREATRLTEAVNVTRNASDSAVNRQKDAADRLERSQVGLESAEESWTSTLTELGLHSHFQRDGALNAVTTIGRLSGDTQRAIALRQRVTAMQEQNADTDGLIRTIFTDAGFQAPEKAEGLLALQDLASRWEAHSGAMGQRQEIARESANWQDERTGLVVSGEKVQQEIDRLLEDAGCTTGDQFRELAARAGERRQLEEELEAIRRSAPDLFGPQSTAIDSALANSEPERLQAELLAFQERDGEKTVERDDVVGRAAEVRAELNQLETEAEVARLHAEIDELTEQLREEARTWSVLTVARSLLDQTREEFQEQRQPSLLQAASGYFSKMTLGRYSGVRAVIGEERFEAIAEDGRTVPPEHLSRGAAEQLWLSIRFALVDEYGSRSPLPVVLDDLLVNFDPQRARAACTAISALAERQQVIFLTCQPSALAMLQEAASEHPETAISTINLSESGAVVNQSTIEEPDILPELDMPRPEASSEPSEPPPPRMQPLL
ncbi:MAG: AAA family ATPase [Chloroflexi bacterium]|jgi:uncharacterized protein YhaN|nr:AAA family ATPase [Chloroflexota bacterium]MBT4515624.1 AAA family ATPase [Chloroflexota bacterium]MBT5318532.1 AAA family ATPase [Chloroflexota bacterium]